jgi:hypothetical protein
MNLQRLTDEQILHIFRQIEGWPTTGDGFVRAYALAVLRAPRRDFLAMRSLSLLFIGKYNLGAYLEGFQQDAVPPARRRA